MVYLTDLSGDYVFTYGLFGVQHNPLTLEKQNLITKLYSLLSSSADRVDHLASHTFGHDVKTPQQPKSTTFVAYWLSSTTYAELQSSEPWRDFWNNLPDDAGVWREVMTVPKSRFMHASSQDVKSGIGTLLELKTSGDEGYWGVYRHRLSETPDTHTDPTDTFTSPYLTPASINSDRKPVFDIPNFNPEAKIRLGRVHPTIPENLCFVREGQRQPNISQDELDAWLKSVAPHAQSWIDHLDTERNKNGVVAFSSLLGHEVPSTVSASTSHSNSNSYANDELSTAATAIPETNQLVYFLDLAHFEKAGKSHKGHVQLRKNVMDLYGPGGKLEGEKGKAVLFVELCVLKSGDLEVEYVGCLEGTGLMVLGGL